MSESAKKLVAKSSLVAVIAYAMMAGVSLPQAAAKTFMDVPSSHPLFSFVDDITNRGIMGGNPDGTFRPNATLNRAEVAKIAVLLAQESGKVAQGATPTGAKADFKDVPRSAWFYNYVMVGVENGLFDGYKNANGELTGFYGPSDSVTRAQAAKIMDNAAGLQMMTSPDPKFTDVRSTDWFYPYVATAYYWSVLDGYKNADGVPTGFFGPNDPVTRAQISKIGVNSLSPVKREEMMNSNVNAPDNSNMNASNSNMNAVTLSDGSLEVALSPDSPAAASVPLGASNVPYLVFEVTASNDEDVLIKNLTVSRSGIGSSSDFDEVNVYVDGIRQGAGRTVTRETNSAPFNFTSRPIRIAAGSTAMVEIRGSLSTTASSGGENKLSVMKMSDLVAVGAETGGVVSIVGDFPVMGDTMRNVSVTASALTVSAGSTPPSTAVIGQNEVQVGTIKFQETSGQEDILVKTILLDNLGSASASDISNIVLRDSSTREKIGGPAQFDSRGYVYVDLTGLPNGGYLVKKGNTKNLDIIADINDGVTRTIKFGLDQTTDVYAVGLTYNFGARITNSAGTAGFGTVTITGGQLTFDFKQPPRKDLANNLTDFTMNYLSISNRGEPVRVKGLKIKLDRTFSAGTSTAFTTANATSFFRSFELVDPSGNIVSGPVDATFVTANQLLVTFADEFEIGTNTQPQMYTLRADTVTALVKTEKYKFSFTPNTDITSVKGVLSNQTVASTELQGTLIGSDELSVEDKTLTATLANTPVSTTVVKGVTSKILGFNLRANNVADIKLTKLVFVKPTDTACDTQTANDFIEFKLLNEAGVVLDTDSISGSETGPTFDKFAPILVKAGQQMGFVVEATISSSATNTDNCVALSLGVNSSSIAANDPDGNSLSNAQLLDANGAAGATLNGVVASVKLTMTAQGTLTINQDNTTPRSRQVMLGDAGVSMFVAKAEAQFEDVTIDKIKIKAGNALEAQQIKQLRLFWMDGATEKEIGTAQPLGINNEAVWTLSGDARVNVPKDGRKLITVKADFNVGQNGAARSGQSTSLYISSVEANGSKNDIVPTFGASQTASTTVGVAPTNSQTTITLASTAGLTAGDILQITTAGATEHMYIVSVDSGTVVTVIRGANQTSAIAHLVGSAAIGRSAVKSNKAYGYHTMLELSKNSATLEGVVGSPTSADNLLVVDVKAKNNVQDPSNIFATVRKLRVTVSGDALAETFRLRNHTRNTDMTCAVIEGGNAHPGTGTTEIVFNLNACTDVDNRINDGDTLSYAVRANVFSSGAGASGTTKSLSVAVAFMGAEGATNFDRNLASNDGDVEWLDSNTSPSAVNSLANWIDQSVDNITPRAIIYTSAGNTGVSTTNGTATFVSDRGADDAGNIVATFSSAVDEATAETVANYPGTHASTAAIKVTPTKVILTGTTIDTTGTVGVTASTIKLANGAFVSAAGAAVTTTDVTSPTLPTITLANGPASTSGSLDSGDRIALTFSEPILPTSLGLTNGGSLFVAPGAAATGRLSIDAACVITLTNITTFDVGTTCTLLADQATQLVLSADGLTVNIIYLGTTNAITTPANLAGTTVAGTLNDLTAQNLLGAAATGAPTGSL